jgi:hypothetical protein
VKYCIAFLISFGVFVFTATYMHEECFHFPYLQYIYIYIHTHTHTHTHRVIH